jgi:2Fe-2S ferredoxin
MPKITFVEYSGKTHEVEAGVGESLMQVAMNNQIAGILGDCGGNCACATCHVYVDAPWTDKVTPIKNNEREMIECTTFTEATSRLGCQVIMTEELDGLVVRLPESQV